MEELALGIGGAVLGAIVWVVGNMLAMLGYVLGVLLLIPTIMASVMLAGFAGNLGRRLRGEPIKPFRWK